MANINGGRQTRTLQFDCRLNRPRSLVKEPQRRILPDKGGDFRFCCGAVPRTARWKRQRRDLQGDLAGNSKRLPACRQYGESGAAIEQNSGEICARIKKVFAVVENQEQRLGAQGDGDSFDQRRGSLLADSEALGNRTRDTGGLCQRCKVDKPRAIGITVGNASGGFNRKACFADASGAGQREQAAGIQTGADRLKLDLTSVEFADSPRQLGECAPRLFVRRGRRNSRLHRCVHNGFRPAEQRRIERCNIGCRRNIVLIQQDRAQGSVGFRRGDYVADLRQGGHQKSRQVLSRGLHSDGSPKEGDMRARFTRVHLLSGKPFNGAEEGLLMALLLFAGPYLVAIFE